jgi:hypothetical protein
MYLAMFSLQGMDGGDSSAKVVLDRKTTCQAITSFHQELMMIPLDSSAKRYVLAFDSQTMWVLYHKVNVS